MSMLTTTQYRSELHDTRKRLRYESVAERPEEILERRRFAEIARLRRLRQAEMLLLDHVLPELPEKSSEKSAARELTHNSSRELVASR